MLKTRDFLSQDLIRFLRIHNKRFFISRAFRKLQMHRGTCVERLASGIPERGAEWTKFLSCLSLEGAGRAKVPFLKCNSIPFRRCYDRTEMN